MNRKVAVFMSIMLVFGGLFPLLASADVTRNDNAPGPDRLNWTILWDDTNMVDDPYVADVPETIIINRDTGGNPIYLGGENVPLSFGIDNNATDADAQMLLGSATHLWINATGTGTVSVNPAANGIALDGGAGFLVEANFPMTVPFQVNISSTGAVEQSYPLNVVVTYSDGTNTYVTPNIAIRVYITSVGNPNTGTTYDQETPWNFPMLSTDGPDDRFLPYDRFEQGELEFENNAGFDLEGPFVATITNPNTNYFSFRSLQAINPDVVAVGGAPELLYRVDVAPQTPPGIYASTFQVSYIRTDTSVHKAITETGLQYHIEVAFAPYLSNSYVPVTMVQMDDNYIAITVNFTNDGNVDLYEVGIGVDDAAGDDLYEVGIQWEQGAAGGTVSGPWNFPVYAPGDIFAIGEMAIGETTEAITFHIGIDEDIAPGIHYIPLVIEGFYFDGGELGGATAYIPFEIDWATDTTEGINRPRDPMLELDPRIDTMAGVYYNFGSYVHFFVELTATFDAWVDGTDTLYYGGETQLENVWINVGIEFTDAFSPWGVEDVSAVIRGGAGTPFVGDATILIDLEGQQSVWMQNDEYLGRALVSLNDDLYDWEWYVPVDVTATDVFSGTTSTYRVWMWIETWEADISVTPLGGDDLYIEEKTIDLWRSYEIANNMWWDLENVYSTIHIGSSTPFLVAGHPGDDEITEYVGGIGAYGDVDVSYNMDLNEDLPPGTYDVRLTVWGEIEGTGQVVRISDARTTVIERLFPEPSDLYVSSMRYLTSVTPGNRFTVEFNITNIGGQRAHNIEFEFDPSNVWDPAFLTLEAFLWTINVPYVDTWAWNSFDTTNWESVANVSFNQMPGMWSLPMNESLPLLGMEGATDIYDLEDWIHTSRSSPKPMVYVTRIDTLEPGATFSIKMDFNADKDMIPGRVYAEEENLWDDDDISVYLTWFDEENNFNSFSTPVSMKTDASGTPYRGSVEVSSGIAGELGAGLLMVIVFLLVIIIILMIVAWNEMRKPYDDEDDEFDLMGSEYEATPDAEPFESVPSESFDETPVETPESVEEPEDKF